MVEVLGTILLPCHVYHSRAGSSVVGLGACLSRALLFSSANKRTMSHLDCVLTQLFAVVDTVQTLRAFQLLYLCESLIVIVAFEELLNARSL